MAKKISRRASGGYNPKYGAWLFLLGVVVALIVGVFSSLEFVQNNIATISGALALLGLIVGFLNINSDETNAFLIASLVLMAPAAALSPVLALILQVSPYLVFFTDAIAGLLTALTSFVVPGAIVVALRSLYKLASD